MLAFKGPTTAVGDTLSNYREEMFVDEEERFVGDNGACLGHYLASSLRATMESLAALEGTQRAIHLIPLSDLWLPRGSQITKSSKREGSFGSLLLACLVRRSFKAWACLLG
jgi:hypothetical protein